VDFQPPGRGIDRHHRAMGRVDARGALLAQTPPALDGCRIVAAVRLGWQIAREGRAVIEQERYAVGRVTGRRQDFAGDADLAQPVAALLERDRHVAVRRDLDIPVGGFGPGLHDGDGVDLHIQHEQRDALAFEFLGQAGVVDVVVRGQRVANLV